MPIKKNASETNPTMSSRMWFRLVLVYLLLPLVLFVSAWSLAWWQGWVYSLLILSIGIGGRLWAEYQNPGLTAERQNIENLQKAKVWDKILAPLMAVSISYFMVVVAGMDYRYNGSLEFPLWVNLIGFLFIALGYIFATWALAENHFFYSVVIIQADKGHVVCDSGPYRFVRHPGYAGNIFPLFGIVLALNSLWALIPAVFAVIIMFIRTALEDQALREELPGYRDYAKRVRYRLIPCVY